MKRLDDDHYELESGRRFYANRGIIGLAPDRAQISEGYDGSVTQELNGRPCWETDWDEAGNDVSEYLSAGEAREIANYMIGLWAAWQERHGTE